MLAGVGPVRARAVGLEVLLLRREEAPSGARVGPPAREAARVVPRELLERLDPALTPPGGPDPLDPDTPLRRRPLGRRLRVPAPAVPAAHGCTSTSALVRTRRRGAGPGSPRPSDSSASSLATTASDASEKSSRSAASPSSVIHC